MKIFLSWSGNRSKAVAELLNDWLRCVIQAAKPWISSRDIDRGALWFNEVSGSLNETSVGIVCLTSDNKNRPWILFEAGALAKGLSHARVCTLLVDIQPTDIEDPLAQFNHTFPNRESMWSLVRTLNGLLQLTALDERILIRVFDTYWPQFEQEFAKVINDVPAESKPEKRSEQSLLSEILANTRTVNLRVRDLESQMEAAAVRMTRLKSSPTPMADAVRRNLNNDIEIEIEGAQRSIMDRTRDKMMQDRISEIRRRAQKEANADRDPNERDT